MIPEATWRCRRCDELVANMAEHYRATGHGAFDNAKPVPVAVRVTPPTRHHAPAPPRRRQRLHPRRL